MSEENLHLGDLKTGQRLTGVIPNQVVQIIAITELDEDLIEMVYRDQAGQISEQTLSASDLDSIVILSDSDSAPRFDADPQEFQLAAEALRIKYAALYDPMVAVNSSNIDPLPHQIRAVYEELLPKIPLRFLLADDPGAGKTIMAGLYLKELILRSDCDRALIVAPGGLVEQWRDELSEKFDLSFELFHRQLVDETQAGNPFQEHPFLIVRMDQICRNEELCGMLRDVNWDVVIVDEAHRMSANYSSWMGDIDETKRFKLGRLLSETAHNFLLMTATPHAGSEENFQLFMSLLDRDRFEGQYRHGVHRTNTDGLMRRMVKEDLLTFAGKPLFPERRAYTVSYELSDAERNLYEEVTDYVRTEMGRADQVAQQDGRRGSNIGFALTVLQRRLASSPEAILRSLERRKAKLEAQLEQARCTGLCFESDFIPLDEYDDEVSILDRAQFETTVDEIVGSVTAAQTIPELEHEISVLGRLIEVARIVHNQDEDAKWVELRTILDEQILATDSSGAPRKIIIFTEHRDTLSYLHDKITSQLGRAEAVVTIHGGTPREERKRIREQFSHHPDSVVLLATDAAGEGLNLQRAHLMVNYDLPWNPNRIEQRFGRIHRIGQREVCHLWNLVAEDTREGDVFIRLLEKIDNMNQAYNGNLFNVLGDATAFQSKSLKDLLIDAIRYGDQPETKAQLNNIIDASVSAGLDSIIKERALNKELFSTLNLEGVRNRMEKARQRKLQPGFISAFFLPAFNRLGGRIRKREHGRFEITRIPPCIIHAARTRNRRVLLPERYERVTFETDFIHHPSHIEAELLAPGHPLLQAVLDLTIKELGGTLENGTVLIDRSDRQPATPMLVYAVEQRLESAADGQKVSHHFDYVAISEHTQPVVTTAPLYLDLEAPTEAELPMIKNIMNASWFSQNHDKTIRTWAYREGLKPRQEEVENLRNSDIETTRSQVKERLVAEINHWDREYARLLAAEREGIESRMRASVAKARSQQLEQRLAKRLQELDDARKLTVLPPKICGMAVVIPESLLVGRPEVFARNTQEVERRAVAAVLAAEKALGRIPEEQAHNNPGFDVLSHDPSGANFYIEVKGRIDGADTFTITTGEVSFAQTHKDRHRLALVKVSPLGQEHDELRYIQHAFDHIDPSVTTASYNEKWQDYWSRGGPPE